MKPTPRPSWSWVVVLLLVVGCGGRLPATHYYLLQPSESAASAAAGTEIEIGVQPFVVDPPFDQDRIVYRVGESSPEIGYYDYHRWVAPLARMLPGVVATAFQEIEGLASIEPVTSGRSYTHYLSGRLVSLAEIDLPEGQRVEARVELSLRDEGGEEIWSAAPAGSSIVHTDSVERIVVEMRAVLQAALARAYPSLYTRLVLLQQEAPAPPD